MNYKGGVGRMWVCMDCAVVFQLHSIRKNLKKNPFCPSCGDNYDVSAYKIEKPAKGQKKVRQPWTDEEIEVIKKCAAGERPPHQVAIELGRSVTSVNRRVARMRQESRVRVL